MYFVGYVTAMAPVAERVRTPVGEREAVTARGEDHRRRRVAGAPPGKRGKEVRSVSAKALRVGRAKALAVGIAATSVAVLGEAGGTDLHGAAVSPDRERRAAVDPRTEWAGAELDDARVLVAFRGTNGGTGPHEAAVSLEEAPSPDGEEVPHEAGERPLEERDTANPTATWWSSVARSRGRWEVS